MAEKKTERHAALAVNCCVSGVNLCRVKVALVVFLAFLVGLIALADSGHGQRLFALVERMPAGDKLGHFTLFGVLSFLVNLILRAAGLRWGKIVLLKGSVLVMSFVTVEEFSQLLFRSRTFDLLDLLAGALGIWTCGWVAAQYLRRKQMRLTAAPTDERAESL